MSCNPDRRCFFSLGPLAWAPLVCLFLIEYRPFACILMQPLCSPSFMDVGHYGSALLSSTSVSTTSLTFLPERHAHSPTLVFNIPCALAPNIGTLLVCRFLCGFFASAPLTLAGGTISDVWDNNERGLAIALFAAAPYGGPVLGPIVGGFVGENIGWRWMLWVNMIFAGVT